MQYIEIEPTYKSPHVVFNPENGQLSISGKSILINVEEFYRPLLNWMDTFVENPTCDNVHFIFDVEYFNLASTKRFLFLLIKLQSLVKKGIELKVTWAHVSNDKYVLEMGEDLSQLLQHPFEFKAYDKVETKLFSSN